VRTLVLNQAYMPIDIQDWKKAVKKVFKEKAEILDAYTDKKLSDWSALNAPAVIRLLHFLNPPKKTRFEPFTRKNVWLRDKGLCQYCGKFVPLKDMHWEHVIPKKRGGKTNWQNIACACLKCNQKKADRTPEEAGMKLLRTPKAPVRKLSKEKEMVLRLKSLKNNFPHESWKTYVYFNIPLEEDN